MPEKSWENYEQVATELLRQIKEHFGLSDVEPKQKVAGTDTDWVIDAKGIRSETGRIVVIECRRYTTSGIDQEAMGGLCFKVQDLGADGGILVSPFLPQKGARQIAAARNIALVRLTPDSTTTNYLLHFLNKVMAGNFVDSISVTPGIDSIELIDEETDQTSTS